MKIKKIVLENIRSYINQEIEFTNGITLLSGDIGSGKSTVLQAMDFALFGLSKGIITGEALLRHGEKQGSIELEFIIDEIYKFLLCNPERLIPLCVDCHKEEK